MGGFFSTFNGDVSTPRFATTPFKRCANGDLRPVTVPAGDAERDLAISCATFSGRAGERRCDSGNLSGVGGTCCTSRNPALRGEGVLEDALRGPEWGEPGCDNGERGDNEWGVLGDNEFPE